MISTLHHQTTSIVEWVVQSRRRHLVCMLLVLITLFDIGTVVVRTFIMGSLHEAGAFLIWNLFLAWIPLITAFGAYELHTRRARSVYLLPFIIVWLLFLPNAPYIVSDLVHLSPETGGTHSNLFWLTLVQYFSFGLTGLLCGFASLYIIQKVIRERTSATVGWIVALQCLILSAYGLYLGRVLRWNSWNVLTSPELLMNDILRSVMFPHLHLEVWNFTVIFSTMLITFYLVLYGVVTLASKRDGSGRAGIKRKPGGQERVT